jgi:ATP-dependent phosphoenolpyruvate carboxykinase
MTKTLGQLVDDMHALREEKRELIAQAEKKDEEIKRLELELIQLSDDQGVSAGRGTKASFTINESVVPQVKDWDAFYKYIAKMKFWHLLQRRPSVEGCRELFETKGAIPGVEKFTQRKANLRSV